MMGITKRKIAWIFLFCFCSTANVFAQPVLKTTISKAGILIGEQLTLKVTATMPRQDFFVKWIEIPDSLQHFELVDRSKIDSSFTNHKLTGLSQTLTFTSFDSGKWTMPAFNIDFNPSDGSTAYNLYTDSFPVTVSFLADSMNVLRDVKDIRIVKEEIPLWYWIAGGAGLLLLIALCVWLYYYLKKKKKTKPVHPLISPYKFALQEMEKLRSMNLSDASVIKQYHTKLSDILKQYLASVHGEHLISSTTGEVVILLNQKGIDKTTMSHIAEALRRSDAAKFAKYIPSAEESGQSWQVIKKAIDFTEQLQTKTEPGAA